MNPAPQLALILAAHGSLGPPRAREIVLDHARKLGGYPGFPPVTASFRLGSPGLDEVLDRVPGDNFIVIPFFGADAHYTRRVLPRLLSRNKRYARVGLHVTPPLGVHRALAQLCLARVRHLIRQHRFPTRKTAVVIIGHGTTRHPESGATTRRLAALVERQGLAARVLSAFLDQAPRLERVLPKIPETRILVVPFLIGGGRHALEDLPSRLGLSLEGGSFPLAAWVSGRRVVLDRALGEDPSLTQVLAEIGYDAMNRLRPGGARPRGTTS